MYTPICRYVDTSIDIDINIEVETEVARFFTFVEVYSPGAEKHRYNGAA